MKPKRIISLLLAICLVAGLMPTVAFATGSDKAIMLGASNISGYDSTNGYDYIYYGEWDNSPIKWRVLDEQTNTQNEGLFLLSDVLLGTGTSGGVYFDNSGSDSNVWQNSTAQTWCKNFYSNNFSSKEQNAVLATTKSDSAYTSTSFGYAYGVSSLSGDKVFFLSAEEAENSAYGFTDDNARIANYGNSAGYWWLRSPYAYLANSAGLVSDTGDVYGDAYVSYAWAARPAFNLDLNSVLFISAAEGGKSASSMDSGLTAVNDYTGNEWKLTLLDETREFAVTEQTVSGKPGDTITLNYTGATTGTNEYISVIIADENGAQYYGRVAQPGGESGTATLSIPADLAPGSYTLNVFSEQYNGDYKTDYASAFAEVALTVEEAAAPGIDTGKAIQLVDSGTAANIGGGQADNIYFGTYQQSSDGSGGYNTDPIKWRVLENADGQLFLLSDQNLDVFQYHVDYESVTWATSTMRSWLNGYGAAQNTGSDNGIDYTDDNFIDTAFSDGEQGAIVDTTVVNDDNPDYNTEGGENTNDKIFLLSIAEAQNSSYFADNSSRIATNTAYVAGGGKLGSSYMNGVGEAGYWWLRSPGDLDHRAAGVSVDGGVGRYGHGVRIAYNAVRPAFNLDLTSVLFTSAAVGGKIPAASSGGNQGGEAADAIFEIGDYDGSEWKLTLLDETREFAVTETEVSGISGGTVTLNYTGTTTGTNEYISVILADENGAQYYGRVAQPTDTDGTVEITIPSGLADGTYTLYVFSEQYNGGEQDDTKLTDYASAFETVALTVSSDTTAPTLTPGSATRDSETAATVKFTSDEAGEYYYAVVESGDTAPTIDTTVAGISCDTTEQTIPLTNLSGAGAKDIYIVAKDAAGNVSQQLKIQIPAYTFNTFTVTVNVDPSEGGTASADPPVAAEGTEVELSASPSTGYHFKGWQVTEGTVSIGVDNKFTMPAENVTVKAVFEAHSFTQENTDSEYLASSATCTQAATYYYSCSCGAKDTNNTFTSGEALGHTLGADWKYNDSNHWKECEDCGAKVDETAHVYDDEKDITCNDCGYERTIEGGDEPEPGHTHIWSGEWSNNETHHWHECTAEGCPVTDNSQKDGYGAHVYTNDTDTTCDTCDYERTIEGGDEPEPGHTHIWSGEWSNNETHHWHECTAEGCPVTDNSQKDGYGAHVYTNDTDTTCDTCDYERTIEGGDEPEPGHIHTWSGEWSNNETHHWHDCTADSCTITENSQKHGYAAHTYDQQVVSDTYKASDATCMKAATYYYSCICGAKGTETFPSGGLGDHNLKLTPQVDATCTTAGKEAYYTCQTCGKPFADEAGMTEIEDLESYGNIEKTPHEPSPWQYNDAEHWMECRSCKIELERGAHVYTNDTTCDTCGYVKPTYAISASPETLDFGSKAVDYTEAPAAQTVTLTNTGNQTVTVNLPVGANYTITAGDSFAGGTATLAPNGTAAFTGQPNTGLGVGTYAETLTVSGGNNVSASIELSFTVLETYTLTVDLNGGSGSTIGGEYTAGEVVNIDAGSRSNYRFDGWTSSNGGSFADASSASTTFIMPAADTTITATWSYNGGGGGSSYDDYTITDSAGTGGSISPSGSGASGTAGGAQAGATVTIPQTGDEMPLELIIGVLIVAGCAFVGLLVARKRKNDKK